MTAGGLKLALQANALFDPQLHGSLLRRAGCSTALTDQEGQMDVFSLLSLLLLGLHLVRFQDFRQAVSRFTCLV